MTSYSVEQFILYEIDDYVAIQNSHNFVVLNDKKMIELFRVLDSENRNVIDDKYLKSFFSDNYTKYVDFMLVHQLIRKNSIIYNVSEIVCLTNSKGISDSIAYNSLGYRQLIRSILFDSTINLDNSLEQLIKQHGKDTLYMVVLNPFDYIHFKSICNKLWNSNCYFGFVIAYNSSYYITNICKKEWHNPCPQCFFMQLEAGLRAYQQNSSEITFQTIIDLIYNNKMEYYPELPVNNYNVLSLTFNLLDLLNADVNILSKRIVEIKNNNVYYDQATHCELCECFSYGDNDEVR